LNFQSVKSIFVQTKIAMKKYLLVSLFSLLFIYSNTFSQGFNSITTPDGINIIAVGNNGNLFRSSNGGTTWSKNVVSGYNFKSVASFNNTVWIATADGKVIKTSKGQSVLTPANVSLVSLNGVTFLDEQNGYTCGNGGEVYRTTNGGASWEVRNSGIAISAKLNSISFKDINNGVVVGDGGVIYMTVNAGMTWTASSSTTSRNLLKVKYFTDGACAVGEYGVLLRKPTSGSWAPVNMKIVTDIRGISGLDYNNIKVCGGGGFIRSNSNNSAGFLSFEANPMMANLVDIFYYDANTGFAVSSMNDAIIKTTNNGANWNLTAGASATYSWNVKLTASGSIGNTLCPHPNKRDEMFVVYGRTVYVSRDRGETWSTLATIQGTGISTSARAHSFYVNPADTNIMLAAMAGSPTDAVVRSTDYGVTWSISYAQNFSSYGQPLEQDQNNPSTYYFVPDGGGFYKSTNYGANFTNISSYPFVSPCDIIVMHDSANVLYVGESSPSRVYKSSNSGVNWSLVLTSTGSEIPSMANSIFDKRIAYATTFSTPLWKTTNHGDNWTQVYTLTGSGWGSDLCREDPNVYLTGTYSGSTGYKTLNGGATFVTSTITSGSGAGIIVMEKGYMLAQQTTNCLKLNVSYSVITDVTETNLSSNVPSKFNLHQNYPNPFNPVTNIKFDVVKTGMVKLKVYDQLGKEVASLVDGVRNAGTYEVQFDAAKFNSGVYFYKLEANDFAMTKKMLLVK